jgi:hypothetical protein
MLLVASLAPFFLLATYVAAKPVVTRNYPSGVPLPITRHLNFNGTLNLVQKDQARVANFANQFGLSTSSTPNLPLNDDGVIYATTIGVGDPPTSCEFVDFCLAIPYMPILDNLIIDTGSSNTWVGADKPYVKTKSSVKTSDSVVSIVSRRISGPAQLKS